MSDMPQDTPRVASAAAIAARYTSDGETVNISGAPGVDFWVRLRRVPLTDRILSGKAANAILSHLEFELKPWTDKRSEQQKAKDEYEFKIRVLAIGFVEPRFVAVGEPDIDANQIGPMHLNPYEIDNAYRYCFGSAVPPIDEAPFRGNGVDHSESGEPAPASDALQHDAEPVAVAEVADGDGDG